MRVRVSQARVARRVASNVALASAYVVVARLGLMVHPVSGFATLVWAPTGLSLVALLVCGYETWPAVALGAFVTNLSVGASAPVAFGIAVGNALEALAGAWALKRLAGGPPSLGRVRDVLGLIGFAAIGTTTLSATIGVASLWVGGLVPAFRLFETWRTWWVGDAMGDLVVAPLLLVVWAIVRSGRGAGHAGRTTVSRPSRADLAEVGALAVTLIATSLLVFVFCARDTEAASMLREVYLVFPLVMWAGLRFGSRGAALANFVVSAIAVTGTSLGRGPFVMASLSASLLHLQAFMAVVAATGLVLGSASEERRHAIALRDSLISLASHELRTPLTSLQLRIQLLARNARAEVRSEDRFARDVISAEEQVKRMGRLIDDLLDISRIMAGRMRLDIEAVDLRAFVRDVVDRVPESQRTLVKLVSEGDPIVGHWDRMRVDQIVSNLLSNALKYGDGHPVEISMVRAGAGARLVVRDRGSGIAEADRSRIFERFERAAPRHVGGFGLGLWIVRQVVEAHGGTIAVESQLGRGSAFIVDLPLEPPAASGAHRTDGRGRL